MKKFRLTSVSFLSLLLVFSFYSCNVYHSAPGTIAEAVESNSRVRVVTKDNNSYEFKSLQMEGNELVGITGKNSETANKLNGFPQEPYGKHLKVRFQKEEILAVYLKNKNASRWVNIGVPAVGAAGIIGVTSSGFRPDVGY